MLVKHRVLEGNTTWVGFVCLREGRRVADNDSGTGGACRYALLFGGFFGEEFIEIGALGDVIERLDDFFASDIDLFGG